MLKTIRAVFFRCLLLVAAFAVSGVTNWPVHAQNPSDPKTEEGWLLVGSFSGIASSRLGDKVWNLLLEMQNDGDLYQDLGALSLGLGVDFGDEGKLDWDNFFTRSVFPLHEDLASGTNLTAEHISRYIDLQTFVSRGRIRYAYVPDIIDDHGIQFQIEGGVSLSLARARSPLKLGDRPLDEALAERDVEDFRTLTGEIEGKSQNNLLGLSAEGARALAQWVADKVGKRSDTERATIYWDTYADTATLGFDLGVPVKAELFATSDNRLGPGDQVRHISFIGISPVSMVLEKAGFRVEARYFFRYLRETTIIEEGDDQVLVRVRNVGFRGGELVPLKFRPEVRLLGIFKIGYTFFEERWERGRMVTSEMAYRVDLAHPRGRESLEAFLGDGKKISFRPLRAAAEDREGVEELAWKTEQGGVRSGFRRAQIFTPLRYFNRKMTTLKRVERKDLKYVELTVARNSQYRKKWGKDRNWRRQFLLQSIVDPIRYDESHIPGAKESAAAVTLLTTYKDAYAELEDVERAATGLEMLTGSNPALDAFVDMPPDEKQQAFVNLELNLGPHHLTRIRNSTEDEVWEIMADVLLGPDLRSEWSSQASRDLWRQRRVRSAFIDLHGEEVEKRRTPTKKQLDVSDRYSLAKRTIKKIAKVREMMIDGDCASCAHSAFRKWKDVTMLQIVLFRLGAYAEGEDPGFHYEISTDRMMQPVTVSNEVSYDFMTDFDSVKNQEVAIDRSLDADTFQESVRKQKTDWMGRRYFLEPSGNRLRGGFVYRRVAPDPSGGDYCLKMRLFTDYIIDPEISLRIDLRESHQRTADILLKSSSFLLGEPTEILQTPFRTARYHYDVPLPHIANLPPDTPHTLLVRLLNPEGYPVSEERQLRFRTNKEGEQGFPEGCITGEIEEIAGPEDSVNQAEVAPDGQSAEAEAGR